MAVSGITCMGATSAPASLPGPDRLNTLLIPSKHLTNQSHTPKLARQARGAPARQTAADTRIINLIYTCCYRDTARTRLSCGQETLHDSSSSWSAPRDGAKRSACCMSRFDAGLWAWRALLALLVLAAADAAGAADASSQQQEHGNGAHGITWAVQVTGCDIRKHAPRACMHQ